MGPDFDAKYMDYMCYQQEKTPETGKLHWQGYVEWNTPRGGGWKEAELLFTNGEFTKKHTGKDGIERKVLDGKFTKAYGTAEQNRTYCSKTKSAVKDTFEEFGKPSKGQGTRTDLATAAALLEKEGNCAATWQKIPWDTTIRYGKALCNAYALKGLRDPGREYRKPSVTILWGPPGTGKSRQVHELLKEKSPGYYKVQKLKKDECWWGGYRGEKDVLIDEYEPGMLETNFLLQMIDWYEINVKVYGAEVPLMANDFWFTSNTNPILWVTDPKRQGAWLRRLREFAKIIEVKETATA